MAQDFNPGPQGTEAGRSLMFKGRAAGLRVYTVRLSSPSSKQQKEKLTKKDKRGKRKGEERVREGEEGDPGDIVQW